jgi:hypothetical protein
MRPGGRPCGEIRAAIENAVQERKRGTYIDFAVTAQVGYEAARVTIKNMVRSGCLVKVDIQKMPHSNRPLLVYQLEDASNDPQISLDMAIRTWARA